MKKPKWVIEKEKSRRMAEQATLWLFGLHAVRDALENPNREKLRLVVTKNALDRLGEAVAASGLEPEIADPRKFPAPLDPGSVHQGAALEVKPLQWGSLQNLILQRSPRCRALLTDTRVASPERSCSASSTKESHQSYRPALPCKR